MKVIKIRNEEEHRIQCEFVAWARLYAPKIPELNNLYAIPNGHLRSISEAKKIKAEGGEAGIPDLFLAVSALGKHGLYHEVKAPAGPGRPRGVLSDDQIKWKARLERAGFLVLVSYSFEELRLKTLSYINCQDIYPDIGNEN